MYNGAGCRFQAATGYQAAWLEGRSYWSLVHPADVQGLRGAVARRKRNYIFLFCCKLGQRTETEMRKGKNKTGDREHRLEDKC